MDDAGIAIEAAVPAPLCHTSMEPNLAARFTVLPPPPPPAGAVHVPSALRKFVVPPPEADTQPGKELVNTLHSGAVHVPSARRKFVVPPPEADTQPGKELVNTLHSGAVHVPSARRKFVVPPPEADTQPGKELVNTLHSVVSCAAVMGVAGAGEPLTFPATVLFGYCPD